MELVFALVIGALTSSGVYLILRARTFPVVVGLTLLSYGVNLFLFSSGRLATGQQPSPHSCVAHGGQAMRCMDCQAHGY